MVQKEGSYTPLGKSEPLLTNVKKLLGPLFTSVVTQQMVIRFIDHLFARSFILEVSTDDVEQITEVRATEEGMFAMFEIVWDMDVWCF